MDLLLSTLTNSCLFVRQLIDQPLNTANISILFTNHTEQSEVMLYFNKKYGISQW